MRGQRRSRNVLSSHVARELGGEDRRDAGDGAGFGGDGGGVGADDEAGDVTAELGRGGDRTQGARAESALGVVGNHESGRVT